MSRYRFDLACPVHDQDLRRVLAATPMPGPIAICLRREPSYFDAAVVDGRFRQVMAACECATNRIVGFGSRSVGERFVNGRPQAIGYLSALRLLMDHRHRGVVAAGYGYLRQLHADRRTPMYLTTIADGNHLARTILTSGRRWLPHYHDAGRFVTAVLPVRRRRRGAIRSPDVTVRSASEADLPAVLAFLEAEGPRRQFFPCYRADDFGTPTGAFRDLAIRDLLLAERGSRLVGILGGWNQQGFRQMVVHGYCRRLRWLRPFYNGWARWHGRPCLPAPGKAFRFLTAALPVVADDDSEVFALLLETLCQRAATGPWDGVLVGLAEADPLLPVLERCRPTWYGARLYHVCWEDGEAFRQRLDGRPPYLELGSL
jgi:hypothetical protein